MRRLGFLAAAVVSIGIVASTGFSETICFEAEHPNKINFPFELCERADASGAKALMCGEGYSGMQSHGHAIYNFSTKDPGTYNLWLRAWWPDVCSNSVFANIDSQRNVGAASDTLKQWHWVRGGAWNLTAGKHQFELSNREDGIWIDQILLTTGAAPVSNEQIPATTIPEWQADLAPALALMFSSPPTERRPAYPPRIKSALFRNLEPISLPVWLRNNSLKANSAIIEIETDAPVEILPARKIEVALKENVPLQECKIQFKPAADMPRRSYAATIRLKRADGTIDSQKLILIRPYQWFVTGALPMALQRDYDAKAMGSIGKDALKNEPELSWKLVAEQSINDLGIVDLRSLSQSVNVNAYAFTRLMCPNAGAYYMIVRHDDGMRMMLNGREFFHDPSGGPAVDNERLIKVQLSEGVNDLLLNIGQTPPQPGQPNNYWEFGVRFITADGFEAPIAGIEYHVTSLNESKSK